jgi:hypothetical protein
MINTGFHLIRYSSNLYRHKVFLLVSVSTIICLMFSIPGKDGSDTIAFGQVQNYTFLMSLDSQNSDDGSNPEDDPNNTDPLPQPEGIDVDSEGNVLVNDVGHNQINLFDNTGKLIS